MSTTFDYSTLQEVKEAIVLKLSDDSDDSDETISDTDSTSSSDSSINFEDVSIERTHCSNVRNGRESYVGCNKSASGSETKGVRSNDGGNDSIGGQRLVIQYGPRAGVHNNIKRMYDIFDTVRRGQKDG